MTENERKKYEERVHAMARVLVRNNEEWALLNAGRMAEQARVLVDSVDVELKYHMERK